MVEKLLAQKKKRPTELKEQKQVRVFILDDHPVVRQGLIQLLNQQEQLVVCGEASNFDQAMGDIENSKPDIVLVDISLNGPSGIEYIKTAKAQYPDLVFLVHSMHDETLYAERAIRAGARGYIMKGEPTDRIITAIRRVLEGKIYLSDVMTEKMLEKRYNGVSDGVSIMDVLSDRELEIFQLIGEGETTAEIAKRLYRSAKTIETYRARIKTKLNLKDNMQLIRHAMQWVDHPQEV